MKKQMTLLLAAALCLTLSACGGQGAASPTQSPPADSPSPTAAADQPPAQSEAPPEEEPVAGTYQNVTIMPESVYQLYEDTTYDRQGPEETGTYQETDNGGFSLFQPGFGNASASFVRHGAYYYEMTSYFEEDEDYGLAPTFDEAGRSGQSFVANYASGTVYNRMLSLVLREDGTFQLTDFERGSGSAQADAAWEGTYTLEGDVLRLSSQEGELPFLYLNSRLYFMVLEKRT